MTNITKMIQDVNELDTAIDFIAGEAVREVGYNTAYEFLPEMTVTYELLDHGPDHINPYPYGPAEEEYGEHIDPDKDATLTDEERIRTRSDAYKIITIRKEDEVVCRTEGKTQRQMTRHKEGEWEERLKVYADKKGAYKHIGGRMTDRFPSEKEAADSRISAEEALHDMILALIYLTRFKETGRFKSENELFRTWKSYDWDTLDKLNEEGLIIDRHGNKSLYLTEEGEQKAKEILEKYGISDWEKKNSKSE